jgi:hypothetical protein
MIGRPGNDRMKCVIAENPVDAMLLGVEQGFVKALLSRCMGVHSSARRDNRSIGC